jgi:hypothetical protein
MSSFTEYTESKSPLAGRLNWLFPTPSTASECVPPRIQVRGWTHTRLWEGGGENQCRRRDMHYGTLCILVPHLFLPYKKRIHTCHGLPEKLKSILSIFLLKTVRLAINEECSAPASLVCTLCICILYLYIYICVHTGGGGGNYIRVAKTFHVHRVLTWHDFLPVWLIANKKLAWSGTWLDCGTAHPVLLKRLSKVNTSCGPGPTDLHLLAGS